jgi:hypothetical protein
LPAWTSRAFFHLEVGLFPTMAIIPVSLEAFEDVADGRGGSLPCLYSNNSNGAASDALLERTAHAQQMCSESNSLHYVVGLALGQQQKKTASALAWNVKAFVDRYGLEHVGFLTLTFADDVQSPREAQRRFNSLRSGVLADRYQAHIRVFERHKSGRIHYHLLIVLPVDIRSGADFDAFTRGDYRSASAALRDEWRFWRETAPGYGFGRTELLPVKSTAEGIGRYVGKYIGKSLGQRRPQDKGVRLVEYSRGSRMASTRFAWATPGAAAWRRKVRLFASIMTPVHVPFRSFTAVFGLHWAYHFRDFILSLPDPLSEVLS